MRKLYFLLAGLLLLLRAQGQVPLTGPNGYKVVDLGNNGQGDYTRSLILLHEIYNGALLPFNNAVGTITANRGSAGSYNRTSIAYINTSSAYNGTYGTIQSISNNAPWKLKTCIYNGKKYSAMEVPYADAYDDWGFKFAGWNNSSGESLKCVNYSINGQPVNQNVLSDIQDFNANMTETQNVSSMNVLGNLNIGTEVTNPDYLFQVKGKIRAQEIKVETENWSDYVFNDDYLLMPLAEVKMYISKNHHLPEIPSEQKVTKEGINLGEMNKLLTKKVEELTLYLIENDKQLNDQLLRTEQLEKSNLAQQTQLNDVKAMLEGMNKKLENK
jgi:hypothetical protein